MAGGAQNVRDRPRARIRCVGSTGWGPTSGEGPTLAAFVIQSGGRGMSIKIRKLVKGSPITVQQDDDLALAREVMAWGDVRHLPVIGGDALVGVISERDLLRRYAEVGRVGGRATRPWAWR